MTRKQYDKEFKLNAVKLYLANKWSKSIEGIAQDLGVSKTSLSRWIVDYKNEGEGCFIGSGNTSNQELSQLKRELYLVKQERDILKKALAIFSTAPGKGTNL